MPWRAARRCCKRPSFAPRRWPRRLAGGSKTSAARRTRWTCSTRATARRASKASRSIAGFRFASALDYSTGDIAIAYVTHEPCLRCTQDLIARGCQEVRYLFPYLAKDTTETEARTMHVREAGICWVWSNIDGSARAWYQAPTGSAHVNPEDKDQFPYV